MTSEDTTSPPKASHFPLSGLASDGYSTSTTATATCYCGAIQLNFPLQPPGFLGAWLCHCTDCRKITATMFASNFTVRDDHIKFIRGESNLTEFAQDRTTTSGQIMRNWFCRTCGTLMRRAGGAYPGRSFLRSGTVDDFTLHETVLKPGREIHVKDRVGWCKAVEGAVQVREPPTRAKV